MATNGGYKFKTLTAEVVRSGEVRYRLRGVKLTRKHDTIKRNIHATRRALAEELTERNAGQPLTAGQEALLQSVLRHEMRAQFVTRMIRDKFDELPIQHQLGLLAALSTATDLRDRCIERLGLLAKPDPYDCLYGPSSRADAICDLDIDPEPQRAAAGGPAPDAGDTERTPDDHPISTEENHHDRNEN